MEIEGPLSDRYARLAAHQLTRRGSGRLSDGSMRQKACRLGTTEPPLVTPLLGCARSARRARISAKSRRSRSAKRRIEACAGCAGVPSIVLALMALLVLSPMLLAIAAAVKRSSPGPVLFRQRRCGLNGEE